MKTTISLILLSILIFGCQNSVTSVNPEFGEPFRIQIGQTLNFQDVDLSITFEELLEDSRCPEGATCFWAGNGRVVIELNVLKTELNTYLDPQSIDLSGYKIELLSLDPYPKINKKIDKEEYSIELIVIDN